MSAGTVADHSSLGHPPCPEADRVHRLARWLPGWHHLHLHAGRWISAPEPGKYHLFMVSVPETGPFLTLK